MLYVEIADRPSLWRQGLMFRKQLAANRGMLFKFDSPQILKFWGMDTYIPLDIAFVDNNNRIVKIDRIKEMSLAGVSSDERTIIAIEANDGVFKNNNIKVGDKIKIVADDIDFKVEFINENNN